MIKIMEEQIKEIIDLYAPRMSLANRNIIKEFYVDGRKIEELTNVNNISRQRVSDLLKLFLDYYRKHMDIQTALKPITAFVTDKTINELKNKGKASINIVFVSSKMDNPVVREEQNE